MGAIRSVATKAGKNFRFGSLRDRHYQFIANQFPHLPLKDDAMSSFRAATQHVFQQIQTQPVLPPQAPYTPPPPSAEPVSSDDDAEYSHSDLETVDSEKEATGDSEKETGDEEPPVEDEVTDPIPERRTRFDDGEGWQIHPRNEYDVDFEETRSENNQSEEDVELV